MIVFYRLAQMGEVNSSLFKLIAYKEMSFHTVRHETRVHCHAETTLNMIKSSCADRDRKIRSILQSSRLEMDKREAAENERIQNTNSILNSYIEKAKARENQHLQERNQSIQHLHDEGERRRVDNDLRARDISSAIHRGAAIVRENESRKTADAFMDRNKRLLDKGIEAVKRERNKMYFS